MEFFALGIRLSFITKFITDVGGKSKFQDKSVIDISKALSSTESFNSTFKMDSNNLSGYYCSNGLSIAEKYKADSNISGDASWYISYPPQSSFIDVIESITASLSSSLDEKQASEIYVWFSPFCSANSVESRPIQWFTTKLIKGIEKIGNMMLILSPLTSPLTFTQTQCLFEVFICHRMKCRLEVAMTSTDRVTFKSMLSQNTEFFYNILSQIQSKASTTFPSTDHDVLVQAIKILLPGQFKQLDSIVFRTLEEWMINVIKRAINDSNNDERASIQWCMNLKTLYENHGKGDLNEQIYLAEQVLNVSRRIYGNDDPDTLSLLNDLALNYLQVGRYDKAEKSLRSCVDSCRKSLGNDHRNTLESIENLGTLYVGQKKYKLAEPLHIECYNTKMRVLGKNHPETLTSLFNLAGLNAGLKRYDLAESLYLECLELRRAVLGKYHPETLEAIHILAILYTKRKQYGLAEKLYIEALETNKEYRGYNHEDTLASLDALGNFYSKLGRHDVAEKLYDEILQIGREIYPNSSEGNHNQSSLGMSSNSINNAGGGGTRTSQVQRALSSTSSSADINKSNNGKGGGAETIVAPGATGQALADSPEKFYTIEEGLREAEAKAKEADGAASVHNSAVTKTPSKRFSLLALVENAITPRDARTSETNLGNTAASGDGVNKRSSLGGVSAADSSRGSRSAGSGAGGAGRKSSLSQILLPSVAAPSTTPGALNHRASTGKVIRLDATGAPPSSTVTPGSGTSAAAAAAVESSGNVPSSPPTSPKTTAQAIFDTIANQQRTNKVPLLLLTNTASVAGGGESLEAPTSPNKAAARSPLQSNRSTSPASPASQASKVKAPTLSTAAYISGKQPPGVSDKSSDSDDVPSISPGKVVGDEVIYNSSNIIGGVHSTVHATSKTTTGKYISDEVIYSSSGLGDSLLPTSNVGGRKKKSKKHGNSSGSVHDSTKSTKSVSGGAAKSSSSIHDSSASQITTGGGLGRTSAVSIGTHRPIFGEHVKNKASRHHSFYFSNGKRNSYYDGFDSSDDSGYDEDEEDDGDQLAADNGSDSGDERGGGAGGRGSADGASERDDIHQSDVWEIADDDLAF